MMEGARKSLTAVFTACGGGGGCGAAIIALAPSMDIGSVKDLAVPTLVALAAATLGGLVVYLTGHRETMDFPTSLQHKTKAKAKTGTLSAAAAAAADNEPPAPADDIDGELDENNREALDELSYSELREMAKAYGIRANQKKALLIEALLAAQLSVDADGDDEDDA